MPFKSVKARGSADHLGESLHGQMSMDDFHNGAWVPENFTEVPAASDVYVPTPTKQALSTSERVSDIIQNLLYPDNEATITIFQTARAKANIDLESISLVRNFGEFERAVLEGVFAQILAGNASCMTPAMIYRAMTGRKSQSAVSSKMIETIDRTITNCMYSPCVVCFDAEGGKEVLDTNILHMRRRHRNVAGRMCITYEVVSIPILLELCLRRSALTLTPMRFLDAPMTMNRRSVAILNTLQRFASPYIWSPRGESILAGPGAKRVVVPDPITLYYAELYKTAWESDGGDEKNEGAYPHWLEERVRKNVSCILDYWKGRGYIRSWFQNRANKKIESVTIEFFPVREELWPPHESVAT